MSARTTENCVGCLLRSSSGNHSSEVRTVPDDRVRVPRETSATASQRSSAEATAGNEHRTALVAGPDLEAALPAGEREGRVAEPDVPARVAPGILERRGQQHPEPLVERAGEPRNGVFPGFDPSRCA